MTYEVRHNRGKTAENLRFRVPHRASAQTARARIDTAENLLARTSSVTRRLAHSINSDLLVCGRDLSAPIARVELESAEIALIVEVSALRAILAAPSMSRLECCRA